MFTGMPMHYMTPTFLVVLQLGGVALLGGMKRWWAGRIFIRMDLQTQINDLTAAAGEGQANIEHT
jgi:hypothetical protein